MIKRVTHTIGRGRDFPTLARWAESLPPDLRTSGESRIAMLAAGATDPGGVDIGTICDAEHNVRICTEREAPSGDRVFQRATVRAEAGHALRLTGRQSYVALSSVDLAGGAEPPVRHEPGETLEIEGCVIEADGGDPALRLESRGSAIRNSVVIQRGGGQALSLAPPASAEACTVVRFGACGVAISVAGMPPSPMTAVEVEARSGAAPPLRPLRGCPPLPIDLLDRPHLSGRGWRSIGATVDPRDTLPGPSGIPLQRVRNLQNAFARFDGPAFARLDPGAPGALSVVVAVPSTLSSALTLTGRVGRVELRVDWTETPPGFVLLDRTEELVVAGGGVVELCGGAYCLTLEARNLSSAPVEVVPALHVTRGIENAGLDVGMYAGALRVGCPAPRPPDAGLTGTLY